MVMEVGSVRAPRPAAAPSAPSGAVGRRLCPRPPSVRAAMLLLTALTALAGGAAVAAAQPAAPQEAAAPAQGQPPEPAAGTPVMPVVRVKDVARIEGLRPNQLIGLGLVVGLEGTGDTRAGGAHLQMVANMLERFGVSVDPSVLRSRNAAAVVVTAMLPPLARPGDRIDVTVSSIADARSLAGGVLLQTPLQGADGEVYAVGQGPLILGAAADRRAGPERGHPTVGTVPRGAIVERAVPAPVLEEGALRLVLAWPDFSTAVQIVDIVNRVLGEPVATTRDGAVILVRPPQAFRDNPAGLVAAIENLPVTPSASSRVVVSERTGTVVIGHQVRIAPVAVAHRGITVQVGGGPAPAGGGPGQGAGPTPPFPGGEAWAATGSPAGHLAMLQATATVGELVDALNALGLEPRDVVAVLQAVRAAGALFGELEVM